MDDEGMRIKRGTGQRPHVSKTPRSLDEVMAGEVVFVAIRIAAHLAGPARGSYSAVLARIYDVSSEQELYRCGDLVINHTQLVAIYRREN